MLMEMSQTLHKDKTAESDAPAASNCRFQSSVLFGIKVSGDVFILYLVLLTGEIELQKCEMDGKATKEDD